MSRSATATSRDAPATRANPFHTARPAEQAEPVVDDLEDEVLGPEGEIAGPALPPGTPSTGDPKALISGGSLPPQTISVVSLHGGSGSTTVRRVLERHSETLTWLEAPHMRVVPEKGAALLVARTSGVGLERAHAAAREWGSGAHEGLALLGIVLVADGPRTDPKLRAQAKRVARMYPRAWRVEWVPDWHLTGHPELDRIPRRVLGMRKKITRWAAERGLEATPKEKNA